MKRLNNVYQRICSIENLQLADRIARKGKAKQYGVIHHDKNREANILALHHALVGKTFSTGQYNQFIIRDPKERLISALDYYPDRIVHHAIMNYLEPMFIACFTADTYSCIKGRGIHACQVKLKAALKDVMGTTYCLKLDVCKFYPSLDHDILKSMLRRKIKDKDLLWLLDNIIDSAPGVPIGNYLSQYFANFYLTYFDHWLKEIKGVKHYFRYADDIVILSDSKEYLHQLSAHIAAYLELSLKLQIKRNYQVFPVDKRGIDFIGYVFRHTHIRLRKSIKQRWARAVRRGRNRQSLAAYEGWAKHCNAKNLTKKLSHEKFQRTRHSRKDPERCQNQVRGGPG